MTTLGHDCYIVAPATDQSGTASQTFFTNDAKLVADSEWGTSSPLQAWIWLTFHAGVVKAGSPSIGTDPRDDHIWYYNGTPAAQVLVALDYVLPTFAKFHTPDLVISGPNSGWTLGPFIYTLSGTIGAAITAIERGIPAISFSSGNTDPAPFNWVNASTKVGLQDPATITAHLAAALVQSMIDKAAGSPVLPKGYGLSVNMPYITSFSSDTCTNPPFVLTRMATNDTTKAAYDKGTGLFHSSEGTSDQSSADKPLPREHDVVKAHCMSSVTVFTVQLDASFHGQCLNVADVTALVPVLVQPNTPLTSDGNLTVVVAGNSSTSTTPSSSATQPPATTITGLGSKAQIPMTALLFGLGVALFVL